MTFQRAREVLLHLMTRYSDLEFAEVRQALFMGMESLSGFAELEARIQQSRLQSPAGNLQGEVE